MLQKIFFSWYFYEALYQLFYNQQLLMESGNSTESGYKPLEAVYYKIIGAGCHKNTIKRKFSEAFFIEELKPTLNKQEVLPLKLFN